MGLYIGLPPNRLNLCISSEQLKKSWNRVLKYVSSSNVNKGQDDNSRQGNEIKDLIPDSILEVFEAQPIFTSKSVLNTYWFMKWHWFFNQPFSWIKLLIALTELPINKQ